MFENFGVAGSHSTWEFSFFLVTVNLSQKVGIMAEKCNANGKKSRAKRIKELNDYIWSLEGKCERVNKINTGLILQYCRFMVLADELSLEIASHLDDYDADQMEFTISKYEKLQKLALNIYKTLKLDAIKFDGDNAGNPFLQLLQEAQNDGDF